MYGYMKLYINTCATKHSFSWSEILDIKTSLYCHYCHQPGHIPVYYVRTYMHSDR